MAAWATGEDANQLSYGALHRSDYGIDAILLKRTSLCLFYCPLKLLCEFCTKKVS